MEVESLYNMFTEKQSIFSGLDYRCHSSPFSNASALLYPAYSRVEIKTFFHFHSSLVMHTHTCTQIYKSHFMAFFISNLVPYTKAKHQ